MNPGGGRPTGTVTFLFTDIEGSTRLAQQLGAIGYGDLLERHRRALRSAFADAGGVEVGTEGDSFFAVFGRPSDAATAAAEGQRRLAAIDWPEGAAVRVRMGLHTGDGILAGDTYVGNDVNRAARIAAAGHGGQILVSQTAAALISDALPAGTRLVSLGQHRLKDLLPERICQLDVDGLPTEHPPIQSLDARPNNLPTQLTSFVGREREMAEAADLLAGTRLLTLTGPGGTGKTRLSLQLAATVAERFPDGVFFVALEPVRMPELVLSRIAITVGIVENGARPIADALADWLAPRKTLLVLDNFEQVLGAAPYLADLLRSAANLTLIVTSRAALRISGEQEYPVPGLPAPPDPSRLSGLDLASLPAEQRVLDAATLGQYEAVKLFIARAVAVRPGFSVTNDNAPAVAAICARLQGMPLAIELAAARVKVLPPEAILQRLENQLQILAAGARDLPARQQTLRGAIAWSYDILEPGLQRLLDRMSVFLGGADLDMAERVCGPSTELGIDVLDGLSGLVDQSLLRSDEAGDSLRFWLLDTIREFAAESLDARGDGDQIAARHAAAFLEFAEQAALHLAGDDQRSWLERLARDHDNLRAGLDRSAAVGDADTAIRLAFALWRFWQKRGHLDEARMRLDAIAAADWSHDDPRLRARLMEALGGICWWQADLPRMRLAYEEALALWQGIGDRHEIANALYNGAFGFITDQNGVATDPDGVGLRRITDARDLYRELGDDRGLGNALWAIGNYYYFRKNSAEAIPYFREALKIFGRTADRTMESWALHMLGSAVLQLGNVDEARGYIHHAAEHFHAVGDASGLTLVLDDLSAVAVAEGDLPRAARLHGAARSLSSATGARLANLIDETLEVFQRPNAGTAMSPGDLERYGAEGAAMSLDEAVAYALGEHAGEASALAHEG